ncbi:N-acetyltransferase family protein [Mycolicibacter minnesotensis]
MNQIICDRQYGDQILSILNEVIANSTSLYDYRPRTPEMLEDWFSNKEQQGYPVIGCVDEAGKLLGFATYGQFRAWPAYKYTVEHSIYIERDSRRRGIGGRLLEGIVEVARQRGYRTVVGGIDAENQASIALHLAHGFEHCGTVKQAGYKFGRWLDLSFYQRLLDGPVSPTED